MPTERLMFATGVVGFAVVALLAATLFAIERPAPALVYLRTLLQGGRP
jgi:hypothetical protein